MSDQLMQTTARFVLSLRDMRVQAKAAGKESEVEAIDRVISAVGSEVAKIAFDALVKVVKK